jgi:hypothetical protein
MPPSFQTVRLESGRHACPDDGVCVMELASMLAGEPFGDHPRAVSKPLAALLRGYNDMLDDTRRQTLLPYAAACVGTVRGRDVERRRRRLVRQAMPDLQGTVPRRWAISDPFAVGATIGVRVREHDDSALHARMLDLIETLISVGATEPAIIVAPEAPVRKAVSQ